MKSSLLETLELIDAIRQSPQSSADLCAAFGIARGTLARRLAEARHLGADVQSFKRGKRWVYHLANTDSVLVGLERWMYHEQSRSLV